MQFLVTEKADFSKRIISSLEKLGIMAEEERGRAGYITGETKGFSFSIYPRLTFFYPSVSLVVKGERLALIDCRDIIDVVSEVLGVKEKSYSMINGKRSFYWY